jgi:hypothetical protein
VSTISAVSSCLGERFSNSIMFAILVCQVEKLFRGSASSIGKVYVITKPQNCLKVSKSFISKTAIIIRGEFCE